MSRAFLSLLIVIFVSFGCRSQSVYHLNPYSDASLYATGLLTWGAGFILSSNMDSLSTSTIQGLDYLALNRIDKGVVGNNSFAAGDWSDVVFFSSYAFPLALLGPNETRHDIGKIAVLYGETILLTYGLTYLTKTIVKRPRPYVYDDQVPQSAKETLTSRFSFFSGHTSETAANCFFTAKVFSDYYPDSKLRPYIWGMAATVPAIVGYLRVSAGKHFPSDVITGYAVGGLIGILVPHFHKIKGPSDKKSPLTIIPTGNGAFIRLEF